MLLLEDIGKDHFYVTTTLHIQDFSEIFSDIPDGVYFTELQSVRSPTLKGGWSFPSSAKKAVEERIKTLPVNTQSGDEDDDDRSELSITDIIQELHDRLTALEEIVYGASGEE